MATSSKDVKERLQQLRHQVAGYQPGPEHLLMDLISQHLENVSREYEFGASAWAELLDPGNLAITWRTMDRVFRSALVSDRHEFQTWDGPRILLIISAIPVGDSHEARASFAGRYLDFLEDQGLTRIGLSKNVAHWILCSDRRNVILHLSYFPLDRRGGAMLARDLLTPAELASVGLN